MCDPAAIRGCQHVAGPEIFAGIQSATTGPLPCRVVNLDSRDVGVGVPAHPSDEGGQALCDRNARCGS
jgi:hypothetical protein